MEYTIQYGNVEFYNGIIQGEVPLIGNITEIREGYQIEKSVIEEEEAIYLVEKINTEYIAQIEEKKYTNLQEAIDTIKDNEEKTIEILKNFEINEKIEFNKNIILDLKGYTITNNYYKIENVSNLKIIDSTENKDGKIETINTNTGIFNKEGGNIILEDGTISSTSNSTNSNIINVNYGIYNSDTGTITIAGGTVNSISNDSSSSSYGVYNDDTGTITITGGAISSISNDSSSSYGVYNDGTGTITITGGAISSSSNDGSNSSYGVYNKSTGTITIEGGTTSSSGNDSNSYGVYNRSTGTIIINKGVVISNSNKTTNNKYVEYKSYGIYNASTGAITITEGTVSSSSNNSSYGIYNSTTGQLTVGTKGDGIVLQDELDIKGEYTGTSAEYYGYGIYNIKGKLYYYDGKIEGTTKAVYDTITEREENTELNYNDDETILTLSTTVTGVAQIGDIIYSTLQEAIDAVGNKQTTIKILRNVTYTGQDSEILIPSTKNIILDLNGYKITSALPEKVIQNEGILEIIDTSENKTGTITTSEETTINNTEGAKLTITGGTIENRTKQSIYNKGEVIITGGTVSSSSTGEIYGIYNASTEIIKITGGTVSGSSTGKNDDDISESYGIYNESIGTIIIEEGTVSSSNSSYSSYGIYNYGAGTIKVTGGTVNSSVDNLIRSNSYGIYNLNSGIVEITGGIVSGSNKGSSYSSSIKGIYNNKGTIIVSGGTVKGKWYGIDSNGSLYYYGGKIQGIENAISGNITQVGDFTEIIISEETMDYRIYETITLNKITTNVAKVNGVEYDSIQKAVKACGETESTIEILRDSEPGATIIIEENQNITIDLKGYTTNNYTELQNKGILKIVDTSSEQLGKVVGLRGSAISNSGTMTLESGGISDSGYGIRNSGTLNITGGNITNNTYGIYNSGSESIITTIIGGNIDSNTYGVYSYNGTTNISGTGISNNDYGIYVAGGTTNVKEGAEVQSDIGIYNASGRLNIGEQGSMNSDNPVITGETYGLVNAPTGRVYRYDGQVRGKEGATQGYITYTESGYAVANKTEGEYSIDYLVLAGTVETVAEVNGIAFSNLQSAINSVIGEEAQTVKLTNGVILDSTLHIAEGQNIILDMNEKTISSNIDVTIQNEGNLTIIDSTSSGVGKISSTAGVAIENSGTLTLGQDDGTVRQDLITIEGNTYGILNSGTLNFYDGTINGASAIQGTITDRPDGYLIRITTVNGKERYYLSL